MKYVDYKNMKEFYTIQEACDLLELSKLQLKGECRTEGLEPIQDESGRYGFSTWMMRRIHNILYKREKGGSDSNSPVDAWA